MGETQTETVWDIHNRYFDYNQGEYCSDLKGKLAIKLRGEYEELRKEFDKLHFACNAGARFIYYKSKNECAELWKPELLEREPGDIYLSGASFIIATEDPILFKKLLRLDRQEGIMASYIEIPFKYRGTDEFGYQGINGYPYFSITFFNIETMEDYNKIMETLPVELVGYFEKEVKK